MYVFLRGKLNRNLLTGEIDIAIDSFAMACDMLRTQYGETAKECSEGYYYYGKALLELARIESDVLQNGLKDCPLEEDEKQADNSRIEDPETCTEEERKEVCEKVEKALNENFETCLNIINKNMEGKETQTQNKADTLDDKTKETVGDSPETEENTMANSAENKGAKDVEEDQDEEEQMEQEEEEESTNAVEGETMEQDQSINGNQSDMEEPSNLQCAWELLDLNRVILSNELKVLLESQDQQSDEIINKKKDIESKIGNTLQLLAEVSLENENFEQSVEDFKATLEIRKKLLPAESRWLSETFYQLGVAQEFNRQFDDSMKSLNQAIDVIKKRIEMLSSKKTNTEENERDVDAKLSENEVKELEALVPDILEKLNDIKEIKEEEETCKKVRTEDKSTLHAGFSSQAMKSNDAATISSTLINKVTVFEREVK
jgi:hypothetical protein